jgi:hypothetical protein
VPTTEHGTSSVTWLSHVFTNTAGYGLLSSLDAKELINFTVDMCLMWYTSWDFVCVRHEENNFIRKPITFEGQD